MPKLFMTIRIETEDGAKIVDVENVPLENFQWKGEGSIIFEDEHFNICELSSVTLVPEVKIIGRG